MNATSGTDESGAANGGRTVLAQSVLWGFEVAAEDKDGEAVLGGRYAILPERCARGCGKTRSGQARRLPRRFVAVGDLPSRTKNFPENTDVESTLTLVGDNPGPWVEQVTPDPRAITVHEHFLSFQAPPVGFRERAYDPRSSFFGISYMDFATPVDQPIVKRYLDHFADERRPVRPD